MARHLSRPAPPAWSIVVAGGGAPGLAFALALAGALGPALRLAVLDPSFARPGPDGRAYALSPAVARMLGVLGVWPGLAAHAQPILDMVITDSRLDDAVRPDYLAFAADGSRPLAFMVDAERLTAALRTACGVAGIDLAARAATGLARGARSISISLAGGVTADAALLVAADGARSRLRDEAGIAWLERPYGQSGIVGTIAHGRGAPGRAVQHFLPAGPFAILPLRPGDGPRPNRSSLVWSEGADEAARVVALPRGEAEQEIARRAGPDLGDVALLTPLRAHRLFLGRALRFGTGRVALLGDAAHVIHPLAGQGLNLGFGDAAALAERVADAVRLGLDPGADAVLAGYERDRRGAVTAMESATDALNRLFSNDVLPLRALRDVGLGLVDRAGLLKRAFAAGAESSGGAAPRLLRGLPI